MVGHKENSDSIFRYIYADTQKELTAKLRQNIDAYQGIDLTEQEVSLRMAGPLVSELQKPNLRPNTQMSHERRIYQHIIPALGSIQMDKLAPNDIQQFCTKLKQRGRLLRTEFYGEGLSDQTVRGIHTTLHAALNKAVAEKLLLRNPADGCYELLLLELSTGLRRGEICALQWNDLNFRTGELRIERQVHRVKGELVISPPKTKAGNRSVILPTPVLMVLKEYKSSVNPRWMFPSPVNEDSSRDPAAVRKRLQTILERAGCKKIRFHDLRHTFATMALQNGVDVKTVSTMGAPDFTSGALASFPDISPCGSQVVGLD